MALATEPTATLEGFARPVVLIGCGNMAGAILVRWLECGLDAAQVIIVDPARKEAPAGATLLPELPNHLPAGAVIMLGIKPQLLPEVAPGIAALLSGDTIVISMLAGVTVERLRGALGDNPAFVRIMPNTPVTLGQGVCVLYADASTDSKDRHTAEALLAPLGLVEWAVEEGAFNLITALTGCGPAFVFRFIDALAQAASALGMDRAQAERFALATVRGAANLASLVNESPAVLADRVASKGGMTREGLDVLDADQRLVAMLTETLRAARDRGEELDRIAG